MNAEIWKEIKGFERLYQVSNLGRVKSMQRLEICGGRARQRIRKEKILKHGLDRYGYPSVVLCKNSKTFSRKIHRLVLSAFVPTPFNLSVNHKDGNKQNNTIENLEWCSASQNAVHAYDLGLYPSGEKHYKSKLKYLDVTQIKLSTLTPTELARQFGVSACTIIDILKNRTWKRHFISV